MYVLKLMHKGKGIGIWEQSYVYRFNEETLQINELYESGRTILLELTLSMR
jgi:hypothetical protein